VVEETLVKRVSTVLSQSFYMIVEEIKSIYKTKTFVVFAVLMFLPVQLILVSYATSQYPQLLFEVEKAFFLNGILEEGVIDAFSDAFASAMGILIIRRGFIQASLGATTYYINIPIIAIVTLLTCGLVAAEREKGTLPVYVSKPVYRTQLVLTKFAAFALVSFALTALAYSTVYFTYALTLLGPLGMLFTGLPETISMLLVLIFFTWIFILDIGAITSLFSSIIDRSILAGVTSLIILLLLSILPNMLVIFAGVGIASFTKYFNIPDLINQLIDFYSLGFVEYYQNMWLIIKQTGFFSQIIISRMIDPGTALIIVILLIVIPLISACLITEKREVK